MTDPVVEGRVFVYSMEGDEWANLSARFSTAEGAYAYAHEESVRYGRRMLVRAPHPRRWGAHWLIYPANTCQHPHKWWEPHKRRCTLPHGHEGRHAEHVDHEDGTRSSTYWEDGPRTRAEALGAQA